MVREQWKVVQPGGELAPVWKGRVEMEGWRAWVSFSGTSTTRSGSHDILGQHTQADARSPSHGRECGSPCQAEHLACLGAVGADEAAESHLYSTKELARQL